jgi:hypothetical protein
LVIVAKKGSMVTARSKEKTVTRNSSFFKKVLLKSVQPEVSGDEVPIAPEVEQNQNISDGSGLYGGWERTPYFLFVNAWIYFS